MQKIIQRLTIIKASIGLEDSQLISAQNQQLKTMLAKMNPQPPELLQISKLLDNLDYPQALACIQQFINNMTNLTTYHDPEISALKLELASLEQQLNQLNSEHNECLTIYQTFNQQYNVRVGATLSEILRLKMMLMRKKMDTTRNRNEYEQLKQSYEQAQQDYQSYHKDYQEQCEKPQPKALDKDGKKRLKKAFQQASKLCHPDMVADELKEQATDLFQTLSEAYQQQDLAKVEEILAKLQSEGIFATASEQVNDKETLKKHIVTLRERIAEVLAELESIKQDSTYQLIQSLNGDYESYIAEKETLLNAELEELREQVMSEMG